MRSSPTFRPWGADGLRVALGIVCGAAILIATQGPAGPVLTHGVASGDVTASSAVIWARASGPARMHVEADTDRTFSNPRFRASARTSETSDFTAQVKLDGLAADTRYHYRVRVEPADGPAAPIAEPVAGTFKTAPTAEARRPISFVVGADIGGQRFCRNVAQGGYALFRHMEALAPDFFVQNGDAIYADGDCPAEGPDGPGGWENIPGDFPAIGDPSVDWTNAAAVRDVYRKHWRYNRADASFQSFLAATPMVAQWDDHEVIDNFGARWTYWSAPTRTRAGYPNLVAAGRDTFFAYSPIDRDKSNPDRIHRSFRWGRDLELFVTDARSHRDRNEAPDTPGNPKAMLGKDQIAWLVDGLRRSTATWKVVSNDVPMSIPTGSAAARDAWARLPDDPPSGFQRELLALLAELDRINVRNLVFVTTDVHHAHTIAYELDADGDGDLLAFHELVTGPLNAVRGRATTQAQLDPAAKPKSLYAEGSFFNFGYVVIREEPDSKVHLIADVRGEDGAPRPGSRLDLVPTAPREEARARILPAAEGIGATAVVDVEAQPLAANIDRLVEALEYLGAPLPAGLRSQIAEAGRTRDATRLQELLENRVLLAVHINPEARVKVARGPAPAVLQQAGYTPVVVKIVNEGGVTARLRINSPQAGPVYAGMTRLAGERMRQPHLRENENTGRRTDRFLDLEMFTAAPMAPALSGLDVEYALALIHSSERGRREATIAFDVGQGTEDLGFRAETPVLFDVKPAVSVRLSVLDHDGTPTTARFQFVDRQGHVFPPQAKRLAPDLFFQKHIYRAHGEKVLLPPGELSMSYGRGPEYRWIERAVRVPATEIAVRLERWIDPAASGFYSGDHHIHAAGCAHYTSPTEGVDPKDMFRQIEGEALNVGSVLTWGPGFDHQRKFFAPTTDVLSEPLTRMKYDIEVSGFGSEALGHLVLLNLKEQIYPGADGSRGWPTWTLPVLRWAKAQGGVTGYAHSGSGLEIDAATATARLIAQLDGNKDGRLDAAEAASALLPEPFAGIDADRDGSLGQAELQASHDRADDRLPNLAVPELNSVGAQEIFVTAALGAVDFISTMDTDRIREWNAWYHLMNGGLPVKASGETDFPCMSGTRVGQGRSYVQLGKADRVDYPQWCRGIARGRSYVSDGYAHAFDFVVAGTAAGDELRLARPGSVKVTARVAFSPETPLEPRYGTAVPVGGRRHIGDTILMRETRSVDPLYERGRRLVEVVVNGRVAASREVPADGRLHAVEFSVPVERSSWVALRQFPQLHTNPVTVLVEGRPIRASRDSARWALACVDQLWRVRARRIAPGEREEAERAYDQARAVYLRIAAESPPDR